jgi:hypothetical protein
MRGATNQKQIRSMAAGAAVLAAAAMALTGCTSTSGGSSSSTSATTSATPGSGTASPAASTPATGPTTPSPSSPSGGTAAPTATPTSTGIALGPCATSQLKVAQENPSVGAGQYYSTLVFTNTSGTACTLTGFPGVSYVAADGVQSGPAAVRSGGQATTVTLNPGGTADSVLHDSNGISGYSPQQCDLTPVQGLRIYPPNQKAALFLPWKTSHCAGMGIHPLTIGPVTS